MITIYNSAGEVVDTVHKPDRIQWVVENCPHAWVDKDNPESKSCCAIKPGDMPRYSCSRSAGHTGPHVAYIVNEPVGIWPEDPPEIVRERAAQRVIFIPHTVSAVQENELDAKPKHAPALTLLRRAYRYLPDRPECDALAEDILECVTPQAPIPGDIVILDLFDIGFGHVRCSATVRYYDTENDAYEVTAVLPHYRCMNEPGHKNDLHEIHWWTVQRSDIVGIVDHLMWDNHERSSDE